ncbi:hypothetical protein Ahy_B01g054908 [Arachis hypogaea]|uniref:PB1-like domain-containing protein n=1 Tax=Arachis hypogaea TaxID=3818 RepID=A0A445AUG8_ARAHY|nr:hypothetical protein Ahy_B01g054908 [Arachis hypogaea]
MPRWKPGLTSKTTSGNLTCSDYFSLNPTQSLPLLLIFFNGATLRGIFAGLLSQGKQAYSDYLIFIAHIVFMCFHGGLGTGVIVLSWLMAILMIICYLYMGLITIVCHHGGSFVTSEDGVVSYTRDHISEIPKLDPNRLDVFFIRNYYKELRRNTVGGCFQTDPLEIGLRKLNSDAELLEMCFLAESNYGEVHVYYEHGVFIPTYLEEPAFKKGKEVVVEVPTQPVLLRTRPSSKAIPPHPFPSPCINHRKTTEPTQEATSTIPNPISMAATPTPPNQDMDHTQVPAATTKSTLIPKSTIPNPISMAVIPAPPNQDKDHTQVPAATTKSIPIFKSTLTPVPKPKQGKIFQPKLPSKNGTEKKGEPKTTLNRRYITRGLAKGHVTRQITKGKGKEVDTVVLSELESSDSYESAEDSAYKPGVEESSSDEEVTSMPCVHACAAMARAGKQPENFCHRWLTMDVYNDTYAFHINPISGQKL